ncbi:MAG: SAM-dependent methyltransferase [Clostridia bacterium]|nr:SAM-dependent methyltransferase [Clostridia bacterium]
MKLTDKRLKAILEELSGADSFADIGSDHGMLPVYALTNNIVKKVVATDISLPSLEKARSLSQLYGVKLDTRLGDGLQPLRDKEVQAVVIAGMGGLEIIKILKGNLHGFDKYILLPHKSAIELREYLKANDIGIIRDRVVRDGKFFYHLITCSILYKWNINHSIFLGADNNIDDSDFNDYLNKRMCLLEKLITKCGADKMGKFVEEKKELVRWIK